MSEDDKDNDGLSDEQAELLSNFAMKVAGKVLNESRMFTLTNLGTTRGHFTAVVGTVVQVVYVFLAGAVGVNAAREVAVQNLEATLGLQWADTVKDMVPNLVRDREKRGERNDER